MGDATGRAPGRALSTSGAVLRRFLSAAGFTRPLGGALGDAWCGGANLGGETAEGGETRPSSTGSSLGGERGGGERTPPPRAKGVRGAETPLVTSPADTRRMRLAAMTAEPAPFKEGRPGALPGRGTRCGGGLPCPPLVASPCTRIGVGRARAAGGLAWPWLPGAANNDGAGDSRWCA